MNKTNLIVASILAIIFTSILIISSPSSKKTPSSSTPSPISTESISPTPDATIENIIELPISEKKENKNISEIISLDSIWNLYKNNQLGFSIKFPKISKSAWANCREENGQFYNEEGPLPITVFEGQIAVYIAPKYFFDPVEGRNKDGNFTWTDCVRTDISSNLIDNRINSSNFQLPSSIWKIIVKEINNEEELDQFVKSSYGSGCTYTLKKTTSSDILEVQVNSDGVDLFTSKCPINFGLEFRYSPKYHKAVTWGIGQEPTFNSNEGNVLDSEMVKSFTFF